VHGQFVDDVLVAVDDRGGVCSLVRIDSNDEHEPSSQMRNAATGTPDAGMPFLFRATQRHGNRRDGLIARKPTRKRQGILETNPPAPSTLRANRSA
jgi:hypothetical protein